MSIYLNGSKAESGYFNGTKVDRVYANGTLVYESTIYVAKPTVSGAYKYNGTAQKAVITGYNSDAMIMGGSTSGVSVGTYTVTFALKKGYAWADETTDMLEFTWTIATKAIAKPTVSGSYSYSSKSLNAVITGYDSASMTMSGTQSAISVGTYHIYFTPKEGYMWDDGTTDQLDYTWEILEVKKISAKPKVTGTYTYSGAVQSAVVEYDSETVVMSGTQSATDAGTYHIYFTPAEGYTWEDETTTKLDYTWTIAKKSAAVPTVTGSFTYNGSAKKPTITYDTSAITVSGTQSATAAGTYRIAFTLKSDNYVWANGSTGSIEATWSIAKLSAAIPTLSTTKFAWIEGEKHTVTVKNLNSTYVTQSGETTVTDSVSTVGPHTVTWTLKDTTNTQWSDKSTGAKTATWLTAFIQGTSHWKNDIYCQGWNSGKVSVYNGTADFGGADQPYIRISPSSDVTTAIYINDTSLTAKGIHVQVEIEAKESAARYRTKLCLLRTSNMGLLTWSDSTAEQISSGTNALTLYGKTPLNTSWDLSTMYAAVRRPTNMSSSYTGIQSLYWRIIRIWHD